MMKWLILTTTIILILGCLTNTQYVCPDGTIVDDPTLCPKAQTTTTLNKQPITSETPIEQICDTITDVDGTPDLGEINYCKFHANPTKEFCQTLPQRKVGEQITNNNKFDRTDCLLNLAHQTKDTSLCETLTGNNKILCQALTNQNPSLCDTLPENHQTTCQGYITLPDLTDYEPIPCDTIEDPQTRINCYMENPKTIADCNQIPSQTHALEHLWCQIHQTKDITLCQQFKDPIHHKICITKTQQTENRIRGV
jgi:hypothetical protein